MNKISEKKAFSNRLKLSLEQLNFPISPTFLSKEFNLRYSNSPVSTQTTHNWLNGHAIPSQEKLQILAIWLRVSSEWLRFGEQQVQPTLANTNHVSMIDEKFQRLTLKQQQLINDLIDDLLN